MAETALQTKQGTSTLRAAYTGPRFRSPFSRFKQLTGQGFWSEAGFDDDLGKVNVQLGRQGGGSSGLRIGYGSAGWVLRTHFNSPPHFSTEIKATDFIVQPNGGVMVPWAFLHVKGPRGLDIFRNVRLHPGARVYLSAGGNQRGHYEVFYGVYLRGAYEGTASPYGELFAQIKAVAFSHYSPQPNTRGNGANALSALDAGELEAIEVLLGDPDNLEIDPIG